MTDRLINTDGWLAAGLVASAALLAAFAVPLWVPYYLARIGGYTPLESGAVLALSPVGMLIGSALAARTAGALGVRTTALLGY